MSNNEIVEKIAKAKTVEKIARKFQTPNRDDLVQYVYLYLLEKVDNEVLQHLYNSGQYKFYIARMVMQQIKSNHSYHYCHNVKRNLTIDEDIRQNYTEKVEEHNTDEIEEFLNELTPLEQEMSWLLLSENKDKKEDIDVLCRRYGITYKQYQNHLPKLKTKWFNRFKFQIRMEKERKPYTKGRGVGMYTKDGQLIAHYENVRELFKANPQLAKDCVYKCLEGARKSYRGYRFIYDF